MVALSLFKRSSRAILLNKTVFYSDDLILTVLQVIDSRLKEKSLHLKGQCPDYAHARASSVFSSKDNRTVILTRQDFLPDSTADRDLLFIFSSNILDFQRSLLSYIVIWLAVRRLIAILSLAGPSRDPKISFRSL